MYTSTTCPFEPKELLAGLCEIGEGNCTKWVESSEELGGLFALNASAIENTPLIELLWFGEFQRGKPYCPCLCESSAARQLLLSRNQCGTIALPNPGSAYTYELVDVRIWIAAVR